MNWVFARLVISENLMYKNLICELTVTQKLVTLQQQRGLYGETSTRDYLIDLEVSTI